MDKLKIWVISDTHTLHDQLEVPQVDCVIHCGDSTNSKDLIQNEIEFLSFLEWYEKLPIKHKVLIAGNHDGSLTKLYIKDQLKEKGIIYLENSYCSIDGVSIYGSPYTPTFGTWYFMSPREKIYKHWEHLSPVDILVTHGPPKTVLDIALRDNLYDCVGDSSLLKKVCEIEPKYHLFGHIHDNNRVQNGGIRKLNNLDTTFINASCCKDGNSSTIVSNGHIITYEIS